MTLRNIIFIILFVQSSFFVFSQSIVDENMTSGISHYTNHEYLDSIYFFKKVIGSNELLRSEAMFWKAKAFYNLGYYKECRVEVELFLEADLITSDYYEDIRFLYCKVFFKLGSYNDSILLFNQYFRNNDFQYYKKTSIFWIGECYLQLGKLDYAKNYFEDYLKLKPNDVNAINRILLINRMSGIIENKKRDEYSILDRANWFIEFVLKEQNNMDDNSKKEVSDFLNSFDGKDDFFRWLNDFSKKQENTNIIHLEEDINANSEVLNELENELLMELGEME